MNLNNTPQREASNTRPTRRRALHAIAGVLVGTATVGTAGGRSHVTEIDGPTVIDEPGDYVLTEDISGNEDPIIRIEADRVTLNGNGHTISGRDLFDTENTVEVVDVTNVVLSDLSITTSRSCLQMTNVRNSTVKQINVNDATNGIRGSEIENTSFEQISFSGIYQGSAILMKGSNNTIQGTNADGGIAIYGSGNRLQDNTSQSIDHSIMLFDGSNNMVRNNTADVGEQSGILLRNINNSNLIGNEITGGHNGIQVDDSNNNTIVRNNITADTGIELNESDDNTVVRNNLNTYVETISDNGEDNRLNANVTE